MAAFARLCSTLAAAFIVAGCFALPGERLPLPPARAMQAWKTDDSIRVATDPYPEPERQKALFDRDLGASGVLPILLLVENVGQEPIVLRREWVTLTLPDGSVIDSESAERLSALFVREGLEWDRAVGVAAGPGYGFFDVGLSYLFGEAARRTVDAGPRSGWPLAEEVTLAAGERLRAFVYFALPAPAAVCTDALVRVGLSDAKDESEPGRVVELPLTNLVSARPG